MAACRAALLCGLAFAMPTWGASPRLERLVVVGDSLLAGYANGGMVARGQMGQRDSAVALLARRAGVLRHAAGEVTSCRLADGTHLPVGADDLISLDLDRGLLPAPPCDRVLDGPERSQVRAAVMAFNAEIAAAIAELRAARGTNIVAWTPSRGSMISGSAAST